MSTRSAQGRFPLAAILPLGEPVVEIAGVEKSWRRRKWFGVRAIAGAPVLVDITLSVRRGEIVVLLGENGAGKTTLLKIIAGLARADAGIVRVLGCDVREPSAQLRRRIAFAGGERGFYFRLTVRENLAFFGALDGLHDPSLAGRILDVARIVDLEPQLEKLFADLSSGQRQRLSIARALLGDPELLLLDEPTRALDPPHALDLRRFVRDTLSRRLGKTILVATNLLDEAVALGDRVAVLRAGTLAFVELSNRRLDESEIRALFGLSDGA
jgi:ABC-type multidrug transport system ATPase subunit